MKLKQIVLVAAGLASLGVAGQAAALPLSAYDGTTLDVYLSGASAQDNGVEALFRRLCEAGTLDTYRGPSPTVQRMMFCNISSAKVPGFPAAPGRKVLVHKMSVGGSGSGVQPVADSTTLAFMTQASTCDAGTAQAATADLPAYVLHNCSALASANQVPHAGFSDVEPSLLGATPSQIAKLEVASANAVTFGVLATKALRDALQEAQNLTPGSETEANMPSLTRQQVAGILAGGVLDWGQFSDESGFSLTDPASLTTTVPGDTQVYLARRVVGSGTLAAFNSYFLNFPCAAGTALMVAGNDGGTCGAGTVNEGSGSSNVLSCLNTHNTAGRWAVGMASLETVAGVGSASGSRWVKINNYAPTLLNVAETRYDLFVEQTLQWRNAASGNALSGLPLDLMTKVKTDLGEPAVVRALNQAFVQNPGAGEWYAGLLSLVTNGWVPTDPASAPAGRLTSLEVRNNPVLTSTRSPTGVTNNCQPPVLFFNTGAHTKQF